jgi:hypothetical protein
MHMDIRRLRTELLSGASRERLQTEARLRLLDTLFRTDGNRGTATAAQVQP